MAMRSLTRMFAYYVTAAALLIWMIGGARRGYYHTTEDIRKIEPITEMEYTETHPKFLPGIEFPAVGIIVGGSFWLMSFLFRKPSNQISN